MTLKPGAHIHMMGICGTAMGSLAGILQSMGYKVTGSDQNVYPPMSTQLESLGISIKKGYHKQNLEPRPDLVIVGNVIARKFEEAQALLQSDIPYTSLPKAMGEFVIQDRKSVVVTGTHGKTTTTSMMSVIAEACGQSPGFLIGGIPEDFGKSFRAPEADLFVIEGDEYDTAFFDKVPKFIHYRPKFVIFSSLEFDHADIYRDLDHIKESFFQLMDLIPKEGVLVANGDDPDVVAVAERCKAKVVYYGLHQGDYVVKNRGIEVGRNQFSVEHKGQRIADVAIKSFGEHNTMNALSAFVLALEMGWPKHQILQGLAKFKGVKRRQEIIGEPNQVLVIEDFAHHPTAVRLTLQAMAELYQERLQGHKLYAVFEPRSATSRRAVFQQDYLKALLGDHVVLVAAPFDQSKIDESERFSSDALVEGLRQQGTEAEVFTTTADIIHFLKQRAKPQDVVLIMSNGGFNGIYTDLLAALS